MFNAEFRCAEQPAGPDRELGPAAVVDSPSRQPYAAPRLLALGDLRDLTLGGSVGRADSGAPTRQARVGGI